MNKSYFMYVGLILTHTLLGFLAQSIQKKRFGAADNEGVYCTGVSGKKRELETRLSARKCKSESEPNGAEEANEAEMAVVENYPCIGDRNT